MGGSQYINSSGTGNNIINYYYILYYIFIFYDANSFIILGRYMDYIIQEVVPHIRSIYSISDSQKWGVFGMSSGGYGAIMLAMLNPGIKILKYL